MIDPSGNIAAILQGLADADAGRGQDAKEAPRELAGKHDLHLDR